MGDRLRKDTLSDSDLKSLDDYRRSFDKAYEVVVRTIRERLQLEPTGRPAKSTTSIIEKLHRESIRLSQMQDIAGCRIVVKDINKQEEVVGALREVFSKASIVDRRKRPGCGYRAVHVIVNSAGKLVEIQVRSLLQHLWAQFSERISDKVDPKIKYGGGKREIQQNLQAVSRIVRDVEEKINIPKQELNNIKKKLTEHFDKMIYGLKN